MGCGGLIFGAPTGNGGIFCCGEVEEPVIPTQVIRVSAIVDAELSDGGNFFEEVEDIFFHIVTTGPRKSYQGGWVGEFCTGEAEALWSGKTGMWRGEKKTAPRSR